MLIQTLTQEEINGLDLTIDNGVIISATITTNAPAVLTPITTDTNIVSLGDSNTETSTQWFPATSRYPDLFGANQPLVTTINKGLTSLATSDIIADLSNTLYPNKSATKRNICTLLVGTNDFAFGKSVNTVWTDYQTLISSIKNDGWELVIFTYPVKNGDTARNDKIRQLNTLIRDNADTLGYSVLEVHDAFVSDTDINQNKVGYTIADGLHFSESAHSIIVDLLTTLFGLTAPVSLSIKEVTGDYTLLEDDVFILFKNTAPITITIPNLSDGKQIDFITHTANSVTFVGDTGITVNGNLSIASAHRGLTLKNIGANEYTLLGNY